MAKKVLILLSLCVLASAGCKKKDRLSSNTYSLEVVPPATTAIVGVPKTFNLQGRSSGGSVNTDPEWTISPSSGDTAVGLTFPIFGPSVTLTFAGGSNRDFYVLTATYEDKTASTQIRVVTSTPATNSPTGQIYSDAGIPNGSQLFAGSVVLTEPTGGAPEGVKFMRGTGMTSSFWMVDLQAASLDFADYPGGTLQFYIRLDRPLVVGQTLRIEMQRPGNGPKSLVLSTAWTGFSGASTAWQAVSINLNQFFGGTGSVQAPFIFVTSVGAPPMTIDIDDVRWQQ